jgi:iron complex transport system substrate-binding protein
VKSYLDVRQALLRLAKILEVPEKVPQKIWLNINLGIDKAIQSIPPFQIKPRVYFEVNRAPYAAGPSSFIGATLHRLGLENIIPLSQGAFPKINPELVVKENPDFIMVGDENYSGMSDRPGWSAIKAIKNGDVCIFKEKDANVIVRPGPRIAEGAQAIANCIADKVAPSKWKAIN